MVSKMDTASLWIKTFLLAAVGIAIAVIYSFQLHHVLRGNRNKWVIYNTIMMLFSGVGFIPYSYGYLTFYM